MSDDFPKKRSRHARTLLGVLALSLIVTLAAGCAASAAQQRASGAAARAAQLDEETPSAVGPLSPTALMRKQRQDMLKSKFEKMKQDAEELASLASSLREDVDKSSENILSLQIVDKAARIEKLAKRIKDAAKGD